MDYAVCNVVYVDRTADADRLFLREEYYDDELNPRPVKGVAFTELESNLRTLLGTFGEVYVCSTAKVCLAKLSKLNQSSVVDLIPTLVLIDIPAQDHVPNKKASRDTRTPSPGSRQQPPGGAIIDPLRQEVPQPEQEKDGGEDEEIINAYGYDLLDLISTEIQYQSLSKLVVPIAVVKLPEKAEPVVWRGRTSGIVRPDINFDPFVAPAKKTGLIVQMDHELAMRFLDAGAADVLINPLFKERLPSLAIHAYRAHKDALKEHRALLQMRGGRKRSWVGVDEEKPYSYLREAMVSGLMDGICKLGGDQEPLVHIRISIEADRREKIKAAVGTWHFSAHDFTDDELLHAAFLMLQHTLAMPELEKWRLPADALTGFLVASRSAYNAFVPYHNFRHVIDVLQAIFHFLVRLGRIPRFSAATAPVEDPNPSPLAKLIRPFDALTLLISAIGHDVGHPGVNNAFLVTLNAPLAQLYNDRSVLEAFHCAAYSQILRRHWPAAFHSVEMRQLMISSILATDMGLHFDYMRKLGYLQEKLFENGGTDGWNGRLLEEQRTLACSLLIKCADISNVARRFDIAVQWTMILTDEFSRQASMEQELGIPSALAAAPVQEIIKLGKSQQGFMNMFAIPLFQGVTDVMPGMGFTVEELNRNKSIWGDKIAAEQARLQRQDSILADGMFSPRQMSLATPSDTGRKPSSATSSVKSGESLMRLNSLLRSKSSFTPLNGGINEGEEITEEPQEMEPVNVALPVTPERNQRPGSSRSARSATRSVKSLRSTNQYGLGMASAGGPGMERSRKSAVVMANGDDHLNGTTQASPDGATTPKASEDLGLLAKAENQRSSDTTEGSNSAAGDWTSQATYTTAKTPMSPSTQGTSLTSQDSLDKHASDSHTPVGASVAASDHSQISATTSGHDATTIPDGASHTQTDDGEHSPNSKEHDGSLRDTMRTLRKKPSRFRMMSFFKRSKSAGPPGSRKPQHQRGASGAGSSDDVQVPKMPPWSSGSPS